MTEYIEKKAAVSYAISGMVRTLPTNDGSENWIRTSEVRKNILSIPAADVVPVRLGEWLDGYKMQTCSLCKCRGKKSWTFCPHCGARMIYGKREE